MKLLLAIALFAALLATAARPRQSSDPVTHAAPTEMQSHSLEIETCAYPNFRTGIESPQTNEFLDWAASLNHHVYCRADLNKNGDVVRVATDICWAPPDSELKVIANLPHLHTIVFYSGRATDESLDYFAANPSLKNIHMYGQRLLTDEAIARFTDRRPDVTFK